MSGKSVRATWCMVSMYKFQSLSDEDLTSAVTSFCAMYKNYVSKEMVEEMMFIVTVKEDQACQSCRRTDVPFAVAEQAAPGIFVP